MIPQEADQTHIEYGFPVMDRVSNVQASQLRHATGHVHDEAAQLSLVNLFLI